MRRASFDRHGYYVLHRRLGYVIAVCLGLIVGMLLGVVLT